MPITVGDYRFRGPYRRVAMLEERPGVWAVLDGRKVPPVAAGSAEDVRTAVEEHPARACWTRRCDRPAVAVFYSPMDDRRQRLLRELRGRYELPCLSDGVTLPAPRIPSSRPADSPPVGRDAARRAADSRVA